jgi:hypothetical protein
VATFSNGAPRSPQSQFCYNNNVRGPICDRDDGFEGCSSIAKLEDSVIFSGFDKARASFRDRRQFETVLYP